MTDGVAACTEWDNRIVTQKKNYFNFRVRQRLNESTQYVKSYRLNL